MSGSRIGWTNATGNDADDRVERLFEDYSGRVYRYCLHRLGSPEEAEDALQATYLNAWRSLTSGVRPSATRPWLFQIASNVCSTVLRTRLRGGTVELRTPEAFDRIPARSEASDELLGLSGALERLPERQRHALLLRDWRGLSYEEIAAELSTSYEAVETLLFRARKAVAAGLTKPEPARAPVRARALATLPVLLPFQHGWSAVKSSLSSAVGPMKVSLGIALGASVPLIAFGLFERGVLEHSAPPGKATAPVVQFDAAPLPQPNEALAQAAVPKPTAGPPQTKPSPPGGGPHGTTQFSDTSAAGDVPDSAPAPPPDDAESPGPQDDTESPGPPDEAPSPDQTSPPPLVTMCHQTKASTNPTVTISIAAAAVDAHLALGDELGACSG